MEISRLAHFHPRSFAVVCFSFGIALLSLCGVLGTETFNFENGQTSVG